MRWRMRTITDSASALRYVYSSLRLVVVRQLAFVLL